MAGLGVPPPRLPLIIAGFGGFFAAIFLVLVPGLSASPGFEADVTGPMILWLFGAFTLLAAGGTLVALGSNRRCMWRPWVESERHFHAEATVAGRCAVREAGREFAPDFRPRCARCGTFTSIGASYCNQCGEALAGVTGAARPR